MKLIKLIEVPSELGAGTRGASLGIEALKVVCRNKGDDFFVRYSKQVVEEENDELFKPTTFEHAKYLDTLSTVAERVCNTVYESIKYGAFPLVLAGDHSMAAGTISGIKKANPDKKLGVIWIDAHADLHSPFTTPSGNIHGMPLAISLAEDNKDCQRNNLDSETSNLWDDLKNLGGISPKINHDNLIFIGVRDTEKEEDHIMEKNSIKNYTTEMVRKEGATTIAKKALKDLEDCDMIYISFDVDSMDSDISVGTGTPVPNGITVQEAIDINSTLIEDPKVCCWEMVEINPCLEMKGNLMAENSFEILTKTTEILEKRL